MMERTPLAVVPIAKVCKVLIRDRADYCHRCGLKLAYIIPSFALVEGREGKRHIRPFTLSLLCAQCGDCFADYDLIRRGIIKKFKDKFSADAAESELYAEALKKGTTYSWDEVKEQLGWDERETEECVSSSATVSDVITVLVIPLPDLIERHGTLDDEAAVECYNCGSRVFYPIQTKALIQTKNIKTNEPIEYVGTVALTPWCAVCGKRQSSFSVAREEDEKAIHEFDGWEDIDSYLIERETEVLKK